MFPMQRVQALVHKASNEAFARRKTPVQDVTVEQILHQGPDCNPEQKEKDSQLRVRSAVDKNRHYGGIQAVEERDGVEAPARNPGLLPFVNRKGGLVREIGHDFTMDSKLCTHEVSLFLYLEKVGGPAAFCSI